MSDGSRQKGEKVIFNNGSGRPAWLAPAALAVALLLVSCSGGVKDPQDALDRMIEAYGGEKNIPVLTSFEGRGFRKKIPAMQVATNYPFDIYQKGMMFKTRTYLVNSGQVQDIQLLIIGEKGMLAWTRSLGVTNPPRWEAEMIKYKFPAVLDWIATAEPEGTRVGEELQDGMYRVRLQDGSNIITLGLDEETWLLGEVSIENVSDSTFSYIEAYKDYVKTDGIWFPNRFSGAFKGKPYYEYVIPVLRLGVDFPDGTFDFSESDTTVTGS